jgi:opacity protein-like surface antigen
MKQAIAGLTAALFSVAAAPASAQETGTPDRTDFYGTIGYTHMVSSETIEGYGAPAQGYTQTYGAITGRVGWQNRSAYRGWGVGLEAQASFGIKDDEHNFDFATRAGTAATTLKTSLKRDLSGYFIVTTPPVTAGAEFLARVGVGSTKTSGDFRARFPSGVTTQSSIPVSQTFLAAGAGAQFFVNRTSGIRLDYTHKFYHKRATESYFADINEFSVAYVLRF